MPPSNDPFAMMLSDEVGGSWWLVARLNPNLAEVKILIPTYVHAANFVANAEEAFLSSEFGCVLLLLYTHDEAQISGVKILIPK